MLNKATLTVLVLLLLFKTDYAQDVNKAETGRKETSVQSLISSKSFVFKAQSVTPMGGRVIQLNSQDEVAVTHDTLWSDLPFFGRAYSAPVDPLAGGFRFTSTDFNYNMHEGKRGGWDVVIEPKDNREVRQMSFSISNNGYATLQVTSNNRQAISYYGRVSEKNK